MFASPLSPLATVLGMFLLNYAFSFETLLQQADQAMYQAKYSGRNRIFVWNG